tara:strand:- start:509 stop:892 length:384 start_codon:yes stop_codon:yes gene_type:complete
MFYLHGIPMLIRELSYDDLKYSYYNVMKLLPDKSIQIINTLTKIELMNKLNDDYAILVIQNLNMNSILGTCSIEVFNRKGVYRFCIITNIIIDPDYNKDGLYDIFFKSITDYCRIEIGCINYVLQTD